MRFGIFLLLAIVLVFVWIGAFVMFHVAGMLIHLLLLFAFIFLLIHLLADRSRSDSKTLRPHIRAQTAPADSDSEPFSEETARQPAAFAGSGALSVAFSRGNNLNFIRS